MEEFQTMTMMKSYEEQKEALKTIFDKAFEVVEKFNFYTIYPNGTKSSRGYFGISEYEEALEYICSNLSDPCYSIPIFSTIIRELHEGLELEIGIPKRLSQEYMERTMTALDYAWEYSQTANPKDTYFDAFDYIREKSMRPFTANVFLAIISNNIVAKFIEQSENNSWL